jgi:Na+/citrate or Na+/malate symporter
MPRILFIVLATLTLNGCMTAVVVGTAVGVTAKVAVEAAKVPVKAGGAVVGAVTDDDEDDEQKDD